MSTYSTVRQATGCQRWPKSVVAASQAESRFPAAADPLDIVVEPDILINLPDQELLGACSGTCISGILLSRIMRGSLGGMDARHKVCEEICSSQSNLVCFRGDHAITLRLAGFERIHLFAQPASSRLGCAGVRSRLCSQRVIQVSLQSRYRSRSG